MRKYILKDETATAVIFIVGIIAVLVLLVLTFVINMRFEFLAAVNSKNKAKATYLAEAGISYAIQDIIEDSKAEFTDDLNDSWASDDSSDITLSNSSLLSNTGKYEVYVFDTQRMVNINNVNSNLLSNLPGLNSSLAQAIINARPFETKHEITKVSGIDDPTYNNLKDIITVNSWEDPARSNRSPVNINTAHQIVLEAVLTGISDGTYTISSTEASSVTSDIINDRPFSGWADFESCLTSSVSDGDISSDEAKLIMDNCNPNREKPTNFTTEFCFNSGGYYEIHCTGTLYKTSSQTAVIGQKTITAIVHIYDIWNKTTKADFTAGDTDFNGIDDTGEGVPDYERVNWLDSCPVNSNDDDLRYGHSNYETISGSIKLGFWDNFDEENYGSSTNGYGWSWEHWQETIYGDIKISDVDGDGYNELTTNTHDFSAFELMGIKSDQWNCGQRFMVRAYYGDQSVTTWEGWEDTGSLEFQGPGSVHKLFLNEFRCIYWGGQVNIDWVPGVQEVADFIDSMLRVNWYGGGGDHYMFINDLYTDALGNPLGLVHSSDPDNDSKRYPPDGNRINPTSLAYKLVVDDRSSPNYTPYLAVNSTGIAHPSNTYNAIDTNFHARPDLGDNDRYNFMWHQGGNSFLKTDWRLKLYTNSRIPCWDEVRLIPEGGYYTSPVFNLISQVKLGAISWTETTPSSADATSETTTLELDTGEGFFEPSSNGAISGESGNLSGSASTLRFKVTLRSDDRFHQETPVFEDITITYLLPKAQILYWSKK